MGTIKRFEDMEIWQLARQLCRDVHSFSESMNLAKDFELTRQISRSSGSAMDNIAEGFGRGGNKEFRNFLSITTGSASEVKSQLYRALDRGYITQEQFDVAYELADKLIRKTGKFIGYLGASEHRGQKFKEQSAIRR